MGSRITGERERETLVKFLSFIYFSLRPVSGWGLQADRQRAGPSGRDAVLPRGMRRRMQRQSEQPVRRLQARHPQQGMPIRLSSWPIPGKLPLTFSTEEDFLFSWPRFARRKTVPNSCGCVPGTRALTERRRPPTTVLLSDDLRGRSH